MGDNISYACGWGRGGPMDEEVNDMFGGEGGSVDEETHSDMYEGEAGWGGEESLDEVACGTCGGGGGMSMDDSFVGTIRLGRRGIQTRREGGLVNGALGDVCDGHWRDVDYTLEAWASGESWWE